MIKWRYTKEHDILWCASPCLMDVVKEINYLNKIYKAWQTDYLKTLESEESQLWGDL